VNHCVTFAIEYLGNLGSKGPLIGNGLGESNDHVIDGVM